MPITVHFEKPPGTPVSTRQFAPGDLILIGGKVTTTLGLPNTGGKVRLDISDSFSSMYGETLAGFLGGYHFDVALPNVVSQANVTVTAYFIGSVDQVTVPIGIGATPVPLPAPQPGLLDMIIPIVVMMLMVTVVLPMLKDLPSLLTGAVTKKLPGGKE